LPGKGDKLFVNGKEAGYVASAIQSPALGNTIGLAYVRREHNKVGNVVTVKSAAGESEAQIVELPFAK